MAVIQPLEAHRHPALDIRALEYQIPILYHSFKIGVQELEDKVEVLFGREDVEELDDVGMSEFLEEFDLADGGHV